MRNLLKELQRDFLCCVCSQQRRGVLTLFHQDSPFGTPTVHISAHFLVIKSALDPLHERILILGDEG